MFGNTTQRYLPDWVILGDNSRAVFLRWLLSGANLRTDENSVIWVRHGTRVSISQEETQWFIETPVLLPRMTLCFPPPDYAEFDLDTLNSTRYAVLEEFPFRKQSSMDMIQTLESSGKETLVVLMDLPRHQGSTDMTAPGEDLNQARDTYCGERCDVLVMQSIGNLRRILHWHRPMWDAWVKKAREHLFDLHERISEVPYDYLSLEEDWTDDGGLLQEQTMDRLFSYQASKREKKETLWDCYAVASKRALFPSSGQGPLTSVTGLYKECLDNPLVFWPVDADVEDFTDNLRRAFVDALEKEEAAGRYRERTHFPKNLDEESYLRLVALSEGNGTALNAVFSQRIRDFLCDDVKTYLQERLRQRYQQLEGMIP